MLQYLHRKTARPLLVDMHFSGCGFLRVETAPKCTYVHAKLKTLPGVISSTSNTCIVRRRRRREGERREMEGSRKEAMEARTGWGVMSGIRSEGGSLLQLLEEDRRMHQADCMMAFPCCYRCSASSTLFSVSLDRCMADRALYF